MLPIKINNLIKILREFIVIIYKKIKKFSFLWSPQAIIIYMVLCVICWCIYLVIVKLQVFTIQEVKTSLFHETYNMEFQVIMKELNILKSLYFQEGEGILTRKILYCWEPVWHSFGSFGSGWLSSQQLQSKLTLICENAVSILLNENVTLDVLKNQRDFLIEHAELLKKIIGRTNRFYDESVSYYNTIAQKLNQVSYTCKTKLVWHLPDKECMYGRYVAENSYTPKIKTWYAKYHQGFLFCPNEYKYYLNVFTRYDKLLENIINLYNKKIDELLPK